MWRDPEPVIGRKDDDVGVVADPLRRLREVLHGALAPTAIDDHVTANRERPAEEWTQVSSRLATKRKSTGQVVTMAAMSKTLWWFDISTYGLAVSRRSRPLASTSMPQVARIQETQLRPTQMTPSPLRSTDDAAQCAPEDRIEDDQEVPGDVDHARLRAGC